MPLQFGIPMLETTPSDVMRTPGKGCPYHCAASRTATPATTTATDAITQTASDVLGAGVLIGRLESSIGYRIGKVGAVVG
jgi:hypothetical protein